MATLRDWHMTDTPLDNKGNRKRTLKNWMNWRDHAGNWSPTEWSFRHADLGETFEDLQLDWVADKMPLQFFVGHPGAAGGRPWWGARRPHQPNTGIVMFIEQGVSTGYTVSGADKSATYEDILPDTDLILYAGVSKIEKWVALLSDTAGQGGTGDKVDIGFYLPDDWTLEVDGIGAGNCIVIKRPRGNVVYKSKPAVAFDANEDTVPTAFIDRGSGTLAGRTYRRIRVRCAPAGFVYPILMDPTIVIPKKDPGIEETTNISGGNANKNYGNLTAIYHGYTDSRRTLARIDAGDIPAGTVTSATWTMLVEQEGQSPKFHRIPDADSDWIEGTSSGAATAGEPCWNWKAYPATAWSAAGCGYVVDGTERTTNVPSAGAVTAFIDFAWHPSWLHGWRDGTFGNGGALLRDTTAVSGFAYSSEAGIPVGGQPYFTIIYDAPVVTPDTLFGGWQPHRSPHREPDRNPHCRKVPTNEQDI